MKKIETLTLMSLALTGIGIATLSQPVAAQISPPVIGYQLYDYDINSTYPKPGDDIYYGSTILGAAALGSSTTNGGLTVGNFQPLCLRNKPGFACVQHNNLLVGNDRSDHNSQAL